MNDSSQNRLYQGNMKLRYLKFSLTKSYRKLVSKVILRIYQDNVGGVEKSVFVVGSARSGTTWLANLIASQLNSRLMFEPFNPDLVPEYRQFNYFQYMRPDDANQELYDYCHKIFTGNIRNPWIDREIQQVFPQGRVIKCIRSSLMLRWLDIQFPEVRKFYIIRHPCAVVQSRMNLGWATDDDIRHFLNQPKLIDDYLKEKLEIIAGARQVEQKHAIIWCITNLVPIHQFQSSNLNLIVYEKLVEKPESELSRIFSVLGVSDQLDVINKVNQPSSTTTRRSAVLSGNQSISQWKHELSTRQIDSILHIVNEFHLPPGDSSLIQIPEFSI
jgi:hypothetical protein